jgi:integrase
MAAETNIRHGFLTDDEYARLRDALSEYLRHLFVTAYFTGVRLGELLSIEWRQVDWEQGFITLESERTKRGHARVVPILEGDMESWLRWSQENSDGCDRVFHHDGIPFKEFRGSWQKACEAAEVPTLKFHDLRRTDGGPKHAPCGGGASRANAYLGPSNGFNGAAIQHRRYRRYQVGQGANAEEAR